MASEFVQLAWKDRVIAEYHSAAITAELLHWLIQTGISPDTIETCHRIVKEELRHAELSREVYLSAGGSLDQIQIPFQELAYQKERDMPAPIRALSMCTRVFCCGETAAVPLFRALLEHSDRQQTNQILEEILADEAGHKYFGWDLLDELLELLGEEAKTWLQKRVPTYIEELRQAYHSEETECPIEDQKWGLMAGIQYSSITNQCIKEILIPRFKERDLL